MQRIMDVENLQRKLRHIYNENSQAKANHHLIQLNCLKELHALTITLANLYELVPAISRLGGVNEGNIFTGNRPNNIISASGYDPNRKF
jgi:hypothetical protein